MTAVPECAASFKCQILRACGMHLLHKICSGSRYTLRVRPRTLVSIIFSHKIKKTLLQYLHLRQGRCGIRHYLIAFSEFFYPLPVAAIIPETGCPKTSGIELYGGLRGSLKVCSAGERHLDFYKDFSPREGSGTFNSHLFWWGAYEDI